MTSGSDALSLDHIIASIGDFTADAILISEAQPVTGDGPRIVWVNRAFEDMTGYTLTEVIGKTPRVLQGPDTDPDTRRRIRESLQNWQHVREEIKNYRKDGTPFWVELSIQPVADANGWNHYWVAIQRDTTARRALQSQLVQAIKLESMGKMTSGIAHDFNNLLAVILGNLELLQMRNESMRDNPLVANAVDAVKKGRSLTHSLLSFARQAELKPTPCDVTDLCTDVYAMMRGLLPENIRLDLIEPTTPVQALLDRHLFQNALLNLVLNARDAMPGGGSVELAIRHVAAADLPYRDEGASRFVEVCVTDDGAGIAPGDLESVLEPFFTTKAVGQGSGLGLSTVRSFVEQSGGRLRIDSEPGIGTRARMVFPAVESADRATTSGAERSIPAQLDAYILVVEDDRRLREILQQMLNLAGARVDLAADGQTAMALIAEREYDVLLSDIAMPGEVQGTDVARHFRRTGPHRPVILISGNPGTYLDSATTAGLEDVEILVKPVDGVRLLETIRARLTAGVDHARAGRSRA